MGHLQKRSGTQAGLRSGQQKYVHEPIIEQAKKARLKDLKIQTNRIKTAKVRNSNTPAAFDNTNLILNIESPTNAF